MVPNSSGVRRASITCGANSGCLVKAEHAVVRQRDHARPCHLRCADRIGVCPRFDLNLTALSGSVKHGRTLADTEAGTRAGEARRSRHLAVRIDLQSARVSAAVERQVLL